MNISRRVRNLCFLCASEFWGGEMVVDVVSLCLLELVRGEPKRRRVSGGEFKRLLVVRGGSPILGGADSVEFQEEALVSVNEDSEDCPSPGRLRAFLVWIL